MSLRFYSDQCVPAESTDTLRRGGHQLTLLREVLPLRSLDPVIIAKAQEMGAVLVSFNGDFADIVAYPPGKCVRLAPGAVGGRHIIHREEVNSRFHKRGL